MSKNFTIVGGDSRIIELAKMLAEDDNKIFIYGLDKIKEFENIENINICNNLLEVINNSEIIIGPIPFSGDGEYINTPFSNKKISVKELLDNLKNKILIAGSISNEIISSSNTQIIDIMKREELAILNSISTAEGTIQIIIENTNKILHGSNVLILGFGRIGKVLAKKLQGLSACVTCAARKNEDLAWIKSYGYKETNINLIGKNLSEYDIIINTVPQIILTEEKLKYINQDSLLIDLASKPGGIDPKAVLNQNLKYIWALALPGKVAPVTTAEIIKDTLYNILKEKNKM